MASKSDIRNLEYTLIAIGLFSLFVVHNADPSGFGPFLVGAIAYFSSFALLVAGSGFARKGRLTYLLLLTFGLDNQSSGYPELFSGHSPLNPFVAYNFCDSITFGAVTCVQVNALSYFADYAFWIAVAALLALILSELFQSMKAVLRHEGGGRPPMVEEGSALRPVESSSTETSGDG